MHGLVTQFMYVISHRFILLFTLSFINFSIQAKTLWQEGSNQAKSEQATPLRAMAENARFIQINQALLNNIFSNLGLPTDITLPLPNGLSIPVKLTPSPILSKDLAEQYPHFMTYQAEQVDQPKNIGRFSISHLGLFGFFRYNNQWMLLSPRYQGEAVEYASYWYKDAPTESKSVSLTADFLLADRQQEQPVLAQKLVTTGDTVRTYKLAISTTGEYTQKLGGTTENVLAELMNLVNRINQVLLIDLALQFELIDNQNIIFFDANSDPYTNSDIATDIEENQDVVDQAIGIQNYDIGHLLGTNGGGLAYVGVVCNSQFKAQGYTGLSNPQGERFYIDLVTHELGHQLGAGHSFNATSSDSCAEGQRNNSSAYEPGSGSTIMSYAGICGSQNLQNDSDPYFHSISIQNIRDYVDGFSGQLCGVEAVIDNAIPQIQLTQNTYTIPADTPFVLSGSATDTDNDLLTFTWEQFDNGGTLGATSNLTEMNSDNGNNPLFRSYSPIEVTQRYFPQLSDVLTGQTRLGETYATTDRDMRFRLTARDNNGGVNQQDLVITVTTANQTFNIDTPTQWRGLSEQTVTWDTGDTLMAPINCAYVDILLIADAVNPIETRVLMGTPNDGQQNITVPNVTSVDARLVLKCSDNVFYALSPAAFSIMAAEPVAPRIDSQQTITLSEDATTQIEFADLNVSDLDSAYPEDFTLSLQNGANYSINQKTLTPNMDFNGMLSVSVVVNDGLLDSNVFSLQVQVTAVNDAPVANNDSISVEQNSVSVAIDVLVNDNDVDRDVLSIDSFSYSGQGQVTISNQQLRYTPAANFSGMESIFYVVSDGTLTDDGTLSVQVNSVTAASKDSGGGSMMLLSLLSFLCFSVKLVNHSLCKGNYE
jgi:predicted Zn-dependent protease